MVLTNVVHQVLTGVLYFILLSRYLGCPEDKSLTFIDPQTFQLKIHNIKTSITYGSSFPESKVQILAKFLLFSPGAIWNNRVLIMTFA